MQNQKSSDFKQPISVIIPVFNEEKTIKNVLEDLKIYLNNKECQTEIIVVNDGSTDQTKQILQTIEGIRIINHPYNKGYGISLKTGVKSARYDWILFYDGDGQHQPEYIEKLIDYQEEYDMVVGARTGYQGPAVRQPGKRLLHWTANYLVGRKIPDLNSGFRLIKKPIFEKFAHFLPDGFSLTTTITLAFFKQGFNVKYVPITIQKRESKSSVKIQDGFKTIMLIFRTIILFSPLKIFMPISCLLFGAGFTSLMLDIFLFSQNRLNIGDTTTLLFISSLLIFFFGLTADQISAVRRERD